MVFQNLELFLSSIQFFFQLNYLLLHHSKLRLLATHLIFKLLFFIFAFLQTMTYLLDLLVFLIQNRKGLVDDLIHCQHELLENNDRIAALDMSLLFYKNWEFLMQSV